MAASNPLNISLAAVVLAAGQSRRMGQAKINLPWGQTTVLGQIVSVLSEAGLPEILVVTGAHPLQPCPEWAELPLRFVHNPDPAGEMLSSLQLGLRSLPGHVQAVLIALGDQPHIQAAVVRALLQAHCLSRAPLVLPSYQNHRGHPWLVDRSLWPDILALRTPQTGRDFLNAHANAVQYLLVDTPSVLQDLDTPEDYEQSRPPGPA